LKNQCSEFKIFGALRAAADSSTRNEDIKQVKGSPRIIFSRQDGTRQWTQCMPPIEASGISDSDVSEVRDISDEPQSTTNQSNTTCKPIQMDLEEQVRDIKKMPQINLNFEIIKKNRLTAEKGGIKQVKSCPRVFFSGKTEPVSGPGACRQSTRARASGISRTSVKSGISARPLKRSTK
jgi:hypothetical protein